MDFAFHLFNSFASVGISNAMTRLMGDLNEPPIFVCVGSDLAIGDSLGPIVGTFLQKKNLRAYVYGTLGTPVTAKEIKYLETFLRKTHPNSKLIAIDAAVGDEAEIGLIKVSDAPLKPGSGANKRLGKIGDASILGILTKKSTFSYSQLNLMRLNIVYKMAETIANAMELYLERQIPTEAIKTAEK